MSIVVPVTALYGAVNAILNVGLAINVTRNRGKTQVFLGVGDSDALLRASRAHGNNAEHVPLAIVMLLLAELSGGGSVILHVFGGTLTAARLAHAHGLLSNVTPTRAPGAILTWLVILALSVYVLILRYGS